MTKILSVNTVFKNTLVFLQNDASIIDFLDIESENNQSELLVASVEKMLYSNNLDYDDLDCFSAISGAGSFIGIKVALSFMKAFESIYPNKKFILNSTFDVLFFGEQADYVLTKADFKNYYLCNNQNKINVINSFDNIKKGSKIITDVNVESDDLIFIKKTIDKETISSLNYHKAVNGLWTKNLEPLYVREPQINLKK